MEIFLMGLLLTSTLTGLVTEAAKTLCKEHGWNYYANTLAGGIATAVSLLLGTGYVLYMGTAVTVQIVITVLALVALSWLCAMVGYDKVIQALSQFKTYGGE